LSSNNKHIEGLAIVVSCWMICCKTKRFPQKMLVDKDFLDLARSSEKCQTESLLKMTDFQRKKRFSQLFLPHVLS